MTDENWARLRYLRDLQEENPLAPADAEELDALLTKADAAEMALLQPSLSKMEAQTEQMRQRNMRLQELAEEYRQSVVLMKNAFLTARADQERIDKEMHSLLTNGGEGKLTGVAR